MKMLPANTPAEHVILPPPQTWQATGLRLGLLKELALKILLERGELPLRDLCFAMRLSRRIVEEIFHSLRAEHLVEVTGMKVVDYQCTLSDRGRARAFELSALNLYAGPAPVTLAEYTARVKEQSVRGAPVAPEALKQAFARMVVPEDVLERIGTAVVSGTSLFLHGPTGSGKTSLAEAIPDIYADSVWIPHALEVDNQIITIFDPALHRPTAQAEPDVSDSRWVRCLRPRVLAGGELTAEMLELQINPVTRFYAAPLQLKANSGVLVIDDLGRQRVRPETLLNRWIVPLDRRTDLLTLVGGKIFEVPFDMFVVFSTNLDPSHLADEAFLRRIPNKIKIGDVTREQFHEIARRVAEASGVAYDAGVIDRLIQIISVDLKQPLRACHPSDIVAQICWAAKYAGKQPELTKAAVELACRNYFVAAE